MNAIKISIVVPNYNHSQYLPQCLNAILQQTHAPFEIIVVDDCSTDNSVDVIKQYMQQESKIQLIQNAQNIGIYPTIHRGLAAATGTHVLFAAADDWLEPTMIAEATAALEEFPQAGLWSSGSWIVYDEEPDRLIPALMFYPSKNSAYINPTKARNLLFKIDSWFMGNSVILNRKYLLEEQGFRKELHSFADNFLYRILVAKYGCCFNPKKLSTWRLRKDGHALSLFSNLERQRAIISEMKKLTLENYSNVFDLALGKRMIKRMEFNLARSIWMNEQSTNLNSLIQALDLQHLPTSMQKFLMTILKLVSKIPVIGNKIVCAVMFILIRPFDAIPQLKLRTSMLVH